MSSEPPTGDIPAVTIPVQGFCPMGHGEMLRLDQDGRVKCSDLLCERPFAASEVLEESETEHIVWFGGKDYWSTRHPLRERLDGGWISCPLGDYIESRGEDPMPPGRYRAILIGDEWTWGTALAADPAPPAAESEQAAQESASDDSAEDPGSRFVA